MRQNIIITNRRQRSSQIRLRYYASLLYRRILNLHQRSSAGIPIRFIVIYQQRVPEPRPAVHTASNYC